MMVDTDDLVRLLRERSVHDRLPPGPALYDRIARRRRHRAAGTAAVAVALALVVTAYVTAPLALTRGGDGHRVADPPGPTPVPSASGRPADAAERTPATYTGGYKLADSRQSLLPAGNTFTYTFTPESYGFRLMLWCDSAVGNRLRAFINDKQVLTDYCEPAGRRQDFHPGERSEPMSVRQEVWQWFGVEVGQPVTVTVKVHGGLDDDPQPPIDTPGTARLLLYVPVPFDEYPFPPPPRVVHRCEVSLPPVNDERMINSLDMQDMATRDGTSPNGYFAFSVTRQPGREIRLQIHACGPGIVRVVVNQTTEVWRTEFWDWNVAGYYFSIDDNLLPVGQPVAIGIETSSFTVGLWWAAAVDAPPARRGG
jgi:hypothetical protein